ncbi:serine/threonine-protein kinase [Thermoactinospora rubra]|uniref:serine/threonine-protein kinase n=1 Tax=Thermoactinospora rubra TaxID=1088767 RepID=UPI000A112070|nr:serine/threonine-protein kinase [Thermoactinospora rubra]
MSKLGKVGPYTLLERLGRGGMGEVYLAVSRRGERVAIKVLRDLVENDSSRIRLDREVRALRRVESPYVARVLDADLDCARPYVVMEYIDGDTLLHRVRRSGPLFGVELLEVAHGIAAALAIVHAAGIVHRDLKPANVLMSPDGPVLIDFGIAQVRDATRLTLTGTFLGTPGYAPPELFADEQVAEPADVYAWAATVAFAATGRPTFGRGTAEAQMYNVLNGQADLKGVPAGLLPLVRASLNREPAKRPTAAMLADRLARLLKAAAEAPPRPRQPSEAGRPGRAARTGEQDKVPPPRGRSTGDGRGSGRPSLEGRGGAALARSLAEGRGSAPPKGVPGKGASGSASGRGAPGSGKAVPAAGGRGAVAGRPPAGAAAALARSFAEGRAARSPEERKAARSRTGQEGKARVARSAARAADEAPAMALPAGNMALLALAILAVPGVVATVIWPVATFGITATLVILTRTLWFGHRVVHKYASRKARIVLRVLTFPFVVVAAAVTVVVWPGLPAGAVAAVTVWVVAGGQLGPDWWQQTAPIIAAGVVFGVVCGAILGREIERVGARLPDLRRDGLRALAVLGGFVALCAAAVRGIALLL